MKIRKKIAGLVAGGSLLLGGGGFVAATAVSASAATAPAATNLYGCVVGSNRVLQNVYTIQANFENFLDANGGKCPSGFPVTVQSATGGTTSNQSPTASFTNSVSALAVSVDGSGSSDPDGTIASYAWDWGDGSAAGSGATANHTYTAAGTYTVKLTVTDNGGASSSVSHSVTVSSGTKTVVCEDAKLDRSACGPFSDPNVKGGPNDSGATVRQEVWNPSSQLTKQDTKVFSGPLNFTSTINAAKGNTAVNSYPDISDTVTQADGTPKPISSYNSLVSTYTENMNVNASTDAEAAYDIWLNNYANELMIWVDNHGQRPAGNDTGTAITVGGVNYEVWDTSGHSTVSVVRSNAQTGTVDILGIIKALQAKGFYSSSAGLSQVDFGFETPSTGGVDENFVVSAYTLKFS